MWLKELHGGLSDDIFQRIVKTGNTKLDSRHINAYLYAILMANKGRMEELLMNERAEFEEMLVRTGVAKRLIEEEIIKLYDKNEYKPENPIN